jgi:hypothetical protein
VSKVGGLGAGGEDQIIVGQGFISEQYLLPRNVDIAYVGQHCAGRLALLEDGANGVGNIAGGKGRGGDLVKQRLEEVVVVTVDYRDKDLVSAESLGGA